ncbi:MAG TPA: PPC domain-containing protein [Coleofasciculaceae cyanobacterium]|jgi:hypothetical protein
MVSSFQSNARSSDDLLSGARNIGILKGKNLFKGFVGLPDRVDYYSFKLTGRSSFNLSLTKLQNNVDVSLLQGKKVISRSAQGGKKSEAIKTTLGSGTYYIRVNQKRGNSKYHLTLNALLSDSGSSPNPNPSPTSRKLLSLFTSGSSTASRLGLIDLSTGNISQLPLGNMAGTVLQDIATFGSNTFAVANPNNLYRIDPNTSTYTLVSNLVSIATSNITSLGFTSFGTLYAAGSNGDFYTVDTTTGKATLIATIPGFSASGDLTYDATSGRFFATSRNSTGNDSLYSIGLTGDARLIGDTGFIRIWGLLVENGTLYGFTPQQQIKIDTTTGVGTFDKAVTWDGLTNSIGGAA